MLEPTNYETDYSPDSEEHLAADIECHLIPTHFQWFYHKSLQ